MNICTSIYTSKLLKVLCEHDCYGYGDNSRSTTGQVDNPHFNWQLQLPHNSKSPTHSAHCINTPTIHIVNAAWLLQAVVPINTSSLYTLWMFTHVYTVAWLYIHVCMTQNSVGGGTDYFIAWEKITKNSQWALKGDEKHCCGSIQGSFKDMWDNTLMWITEWV